MLFVFLLHLWTPGLAWGAKGALELHFLPPGGFSAEATLSFTSHRLHLPAGGRSPDPRWHQEPPLPPRRPSFTHVRNTEVKFSDRCCLRAKLHLFSAYFHLKILNLNSQDFTPNNRLLHFWSFNFLTARLKKKKKKEKLSSS